MPPKTGTLVHQEAASHTCGQGRSIAVLSPKHAHVVVFSVGPNSAFEDSTATSAVGLPLRYMKSFIIYSHSAA